MQKKTSLNDKKQIYKNTDKLQSSKTMLNLAQIQTQLSILRSETPSKGK